MTTGEGTGDRPVRVSLEDRVLRVELARPAARNGIDLPTASALADAVREGPGDGVGAVVLLADGGDFCVGGDIRGFAAAGAAVADRVAASAGALHEALLALAASPVPVVSAIQGWCAGAGIGWGCSADIVLAGRSARFRSAYTALGFTPDGGLSWLLPRLVGVPRAMDFMLTNRVIDADEAAAWGLVSRVVDDSELAAAACALGKQLAEGPTTAHARLRGLVRGASLREYREALHAERAAIAAQAGSPEGAEGIAAFLARRPPRFDGEPAGD